MRPTPERNDHDDLRRRIVAGEPCRIELTSGLWHRDGQISEKPIGELYTLTDRGSWKRKPDVTLMANPENGPEDPAAILRSYADWLEKGRSGADS